MIDILSLNSLLINEKYSGYIGNLHFKSNPACFEYSSTWLISGHENSGFTKSGVKGDMPPQSLIPTVKKLWYDFGDKFGGICMFICGIMILDNATTSLK